MAAPSPGVGDLVQAWHLRGFEGNMTTPIARKTYRVVDTCTDGGLTVASILDRAQPGGEVEAGGQDDDAGEEELQACSLL